jgi:superoxide reductase
MSIGDYFQTADWKKEKHAPVINSPEKVKSGEAFSVSLIVGEEIPHPNTTEHHIAWMELYYKSDEGKFPTLVGRFDFSSHGESIKGANEGPSFTEPKVSATLKLKESGTLTSVSYCNIHGLWESSKSIIVE